MNKLIEAGIGYRNLGLSVIPVGRDKKPLIKWQEFQERIATEEEIRAWLSLGDALMGLAIVTGGVSGNLAVVDIEHDAPKINSPLPQTVTSKTGGGGKHLYYRYPKNKNIRNKTRFLDRVDLRAEGGYVIAPPSLHQSGQRYEWLLPIENNNIADLPEWIYEVTEKNTHSLTDGKTAWTLEGVEEGKRNSTAASISGKLLQYIPQHEWEDLCWPILEMWNENNSPPLDHSELRTVFDSIARAELTKRLPMVAYKTITMAELMDEEIPAEEYLVDGLVPVGGLTMLSGEAATHKSRIAAHIAISVASGDSVFGMFKTQQSQVLVLDEDNGKRQLQKIFRGLTDMHNLPIQFRISSNAKIGEAWANEVIGFCKSMGIQLVIMDSLFRFGLGDENSADNIAQQMNVFKAFKTADIAVIAIHHNRKSGVRSIEHQEMRGSSVFRDAADCHIAVKREKTVDAGDSVVIKQTKIKSAEEIRPFRVTVISSDGKMHFHLEALSPVESRMTETIEVIVDLLNDGKKTRPEILEATKEFGEMTTDKALKQLVKDGRITRVRGAHNKHIYSINAAS